MAFKLIDQLFVHMLFGEYREATAKLIQLNQQYPDFNRYNGFNDPVYDKMKKEYPPFQEALNNLKRKPVLDIGNSIKY